MDHNAQQLYGDTNFSDDSGESTQQPQAESNEIAQEETITDADFEEAAQLIPAGDFHQDPMFYEILSYLNIDKNDDYLVAPAVGEIVDYAIVKAKSNQVEDVLGMIRQIEDQMQPGLEGEKRQDRLRNYVRLLSKQEGLNQKFKKLLSAYEKPKMKKEDLPENVKNRMNEKNTSLGECDVCEIPMEVRDVRAKEKLCAKCQRLAPLLKRYQNFKKKGLTAAEKRRILESRTTSAGSRSYGRR